MTPKATPQQVVSPKTPNHLTKLLIVETQTAVSLAGEESQENTKGRQMVKDAKEFTNVRVQVKAAQSVLMVSRIRFRFLFTNDYLIIGVSSPESRRRSLVAGVSSPESRRRSLVAGVLSPESCRRSRGY